MAAADAKEGPQASTLMEPPLLVGSIPNVGEWLDHCPYSTTMDAYSAELRCMVLIQIRCKRWGCRHCGERRITQLAIRVREAKPMRLITLTVDPKQYEKPRAAYDHTRRQVTNLARRARKKYAEFEYLRVLEITRRGWPHYHLIVRSPYIPQRWLSEAWATLTGARIVDVRQIKKVGDAYWYVVKYLGKQRYIPWTNRKVSWSRKFFPDHTKPQGAQLALNEARYHDEPVAEVLAGYNELAKIQKWNRDVLVINPPEDLYDPSKPYVPPPIQIAPEPPQAPQQRFLEPPPDQEGAAAS